MRYFICKKQVDGGNELNTFITVAFNNKMIQSNNSHMYGEYCYQYAMFSIGYIYRTLYWTDDYIMDENGVSVALSDVADCFEEFNMVIDPEVEKIITTKKAKGDSIFIQPIQVMSDGTVAYHVSCYSCGRIIHHVGTSQYDCIINCYKRIREQGGTAKVFKYVVHGHIYPYGFLREIKERMNNERILKHT